MRKFLTLFSISLVSFTAYFLLPTTISAQSSCTDVVAGKSREQLQADLEACNREIADWQNTLNQTKEQSASYQRDVSALTAKINAAQANIKAKNNAIAGLSKDIAEKQGKINVLSNKIDQGRAGVAEILRKTNELNSYSLVEAMLSDKDFSEFFVDIDTYASAETALEALFDNLRSAKNQTESEKAELNKKKDQEAAAKAAIEAAKKEVEVTQKEKKTLLAQSQNNEKAYEKVLADRQAKAAQIKAVLFPLVDAGAIPFGTALQYAQLASAKTGVRAALILGVLQQESNLGSNVGRCLITNINTGQTRSVTTGKFYSNGIHPTRDLPILKDLLSALGRDPQQTKISCPVDGIAGYGGAMGPTQFIPSTWRSLSSLTAQYTGNSTPDPWNPADAIMAAGILLAKNGATSHDYASERTAACRYYSGRVCSTSTAIARYGNQVMSRASNIQLTMIDPLQNL